ncbi:MAG: ABC transporter permease subunit, partial [Erysipelotrichaceae bacterium]|nr:ABC transporter permease subunit [Erysipelotrichaceae bacterium]
MNITLYLREMKGSWKLLLIFGAVLTMYISMIIGMYDPEMASAIKEFEKVMPELMAAVGMMGATDTLINFMSSYLYGMIMLIFPMVFVFIRSNSLVARYVENGSMVSLLCAPVKRTTIIVTQWVSLISCIIILLAYCTGLEYVVAQMTFPDQLKLNELFYLNAGLLLFEIFIASFAFCASCIFNESKLSVMVGTGIPVLMYVIQMLANMGGKLENLKYLTVFTMFDPTSFIAQDSFSVISMISLFVGSLILLFMASSI